MMRRFFFFFIIFLSVSWTCLGVLPSEMLKNPQQEQRARNISKGIRCVICRNESIDVSEASLAKQLRLLIRERIKGGDSDQQIKDFLVSRYGNFILLKPPLTGQTILLWFGPLLALLLGIFIIWIWYQGQKKQKPSSVLAKKDEELLNTLIERERRK